MRPLDPNDPDYEIWREEKAFGQEEAIEEETHRTRKVLAEAYEAMVSHHEKLLKKKDYEKDFELQCFAISIMQNIKAAEDGTNK